MPRHCPNCRSELEDDGVYGWCAQDGCAFDGTVAVRTGKIDRNGSAWHPGVECEHGYDACPICDA